uniref:Uncharacterized protein n=2 Tax=Oryza brachyantha TaxID=4533 RepID=J3MA77_ORYBR
MAAGTGGSPLLFPSPANGAMPTPSAAVFDVEAAHRHATKPDAGAAFVLESK